MFEFKFDTQSPKTEKQITFVIGRSQQLQSKNIEYLITLWDWWFSDGICKCKPGYKSHDLL